MKKISTLIFILLVSFCFVLAGCSNITLTMPTDYSQITSNGGNVVNVGNFLYFANAYQSYENLKDKSDNEGEKVKQYALKRIEKETEQNFKLDENGDKTFENVVNKIAGYQTSNMFVVNEYLYFTSPNVHKNASKDKDKYDKYEFNLNTLFKIKLDGSDFNEIYTTESSSVKFFLTGGEKQSILIFDNNKILQVKCYENATKTQTLVENVESIVFPNNQGTEIVDVYYTVEREEDDQLKGNLLKKLNIVTGETSLVSGYSNNNETITLVAYDGNYLFYTRSGGVKTKGLYANNFSTPETLKKYDADSFSNSSKLYLIKDDMLDVNVFVFVYNNNIYMQSMFSTNDAAGIKLTTESANILFVDGTYVYYTTDNGIFRVSVKTKKIQQISDVKDFEKNAIDFDGRYIYFYAKAEDATTETKYLHRADVACAKDVNDTSSLSIECISELLAEDIKSEDSEN